MIPEVAGSTPVAHPRHAAYWRHSRTTASDRIDADPHHRAERERGRSGARARTLRETQARTLGETQARTLGESGGSLRAHPFVVADGLDAKRATHLVEGSLEERLPIRTG